MSPPCSLLSPSSGFRRRCAAPPPPPAQPRQEARGGLSPGPGSHAARAKRLQLSASRRPALPPALPRSPPKPADRAPLDPAESAAGSAGPRRAGGRGEREGSQPSRGRRWRAASPQPPGGIFHRLRPYTRTFPLGCQRGLFLGLWGSFLDRRICLFSTDAPMDGGWGGVLGRESTPQG